MEIFSSAKVPDNKKFPKLCEAVKYYKQGKGRDTMCAVVEAYAKERIEEKALETARLLLEGQVDENLIMKATGLTAEQLAEIKKTM
jgi:predicted transposase YdaD